jgi:aspartyl-tRNA(Asn)/glutamyl-tRNA(Gln) amidotransferase subunit A
MPPPGGAHLRRAGEPEINVSINPIQETLRTLRNGAVDSGDLVGACLDAIKDPKGEGARTFLRVYEDVPVSAGGGLLAGLPISIKDLFDVAGEVTTAGSKVLLDRKAAEKDALIVQRLKEAGAVIVGRTNMTEFAFSGLGLNPHYGTPRNAFDRENGRIPGGSSSGAAVSVTDGMSHAAIGTDTGGSVRIPAALCGLTGFKPTSRRVSCEGIIPLSSTLDSVGPIAPTVACCELLDSVLAGEAYVPVPEAQISNLRLGALNGYVTDGLECDVASAFHEALSAFIQLGARIEPVTCLAIEEIPAVNQRGGFSAYESFAWHRSLLEASPEKYDPRVSARIQRGRDIGKTEYQELIARRNSICRQAYDAFKGYDAILLPTTPRTAPRIADLVESDDAYFNANAAMLRNPSVFNFLDGAALSIPCHRPGRLPVGLMIAGLSMSDKKILSVGKALERALSEAGMATHRTAAPW